MPTYLTDVDTPLVLIVPDGRHLLHAASVEGPSCGFVQQFGRLVRLDRMDVSVGERVDFEQVFATQRIPLVKLATMLTGSRSTAEDIVQDVFLAMHSRWDSIIDPGAYARRAVVNRSASEGRLRERPGYIPDDVASPVDEATIAGAGPSGAGQFRDALLRLPIRQRTVVVLRYFADLDDGAIAEIIGCRPATVRSLAHRGLLALRKVVAR